jgi:hypothetical protein
VTPRSDDPSFSAIEWRPLDPARHLDIIKMDFAWDFARGNWVPESQELLRQMQRDPEEYMKLVEEIWSKFRFNVEELIADGTIELQVADVQFENAPGPIQVYRTTLLYAEPQGAIERWRAPRCDKEPDGSGGHYWDLFYPWRSWQPRGWEEFTYQSGAPGGWQMDLIVWNGRPYAAHLGVPVVAFDVSKQRGRGGAVFEVGTVCQIHVKWE